jgi:dolichol kinase
MGMGLFMVAVFLSGISQIHGVLILGLALGVNLLLEMARLRLPAVNEAVIRLWGPVMRSNEIDRLSGTPYYIASALLAVGLFPKPIAALSLLFLACGDPMASLVGILYGKGGPRWADGRSWIGTAAGVLTCMAVGAIFWNAMPVKIWQAWVLTWIGGVAGGMAELLPWEIDDNFAIPVVSGFTLWIACLLLGVSV